MNFPEENNKKIYKVSELTAIVRANLEYTFYNIWVEGEISNKKEHISGHVYFTLKDEKSALRCIMFSSYYKKLKFSFSDGDKVIVKGRLSFYEQRGELQLIAESLIPRGIGELQAKFEALKRKLEKEGLFKEELKKKLPFLPKKIGVVTSPKGAAIRDFLRVLKRRHHNLHVVIYGVRVQGEGAEKEISEAIKYFNEKEPVDVIILTRGGGSIEDLWAFNEEIVARAIFESEIPVISAVGHEIDFTISDFVADHRASTPSVAGEIVVERSDILEKSINENVKKIKNLILLKVKENKEKLYDLYSKKVIRDFRWNIESYNRKLGELMEILYHQIKNSITSSRKSLHKLSRKLIMLHPLKQIEERKKKLSEIKNRIEKLLKSMINDKNSMLEKDYQKLNVLMKHKIEKTNILWENLLKRLYDLSYLKVLERGYSITLFKKNGQLVTLKDSKDVNTGDKIKTILYKGEIWSKIIEVKENEDE